MTSRPRTLGLFVAVATLRLALVPPSALAAAVYGRHGSRCQIRTGTRRVASLYAAVTLVRLPRLLEQQDMNPHPKSCTCSAHPLHSSMLVRDALDHYLAENGFTKEGPPRAAPFWA